MLNIHGRYSPRNLTKQYAITGQRNAVIPPTGYPFNNATFMGGGTTFLEPDLYSNKQIMFRPTLLYDEAYPNNIRGEQPRMLQHFKQYSFFHRKI